MTLGIYVALAVAAFVLLVALFVLGVVIGGAPDDKDERLAIDNFHIRNARLAALAQVYDARRREQDEIDWTR